MLAFRKWAFLASASLLFVGNAAAQPGVPFSCQFQGSSNNTLRTEGLTELVGDLVLSCTGGETTISRLGAGGEVPRVNVQVFLNTNVTSRVLGSVGVAGISASITDSVLLIDEPTLPNLRYCVPGSGTPDLSPGCLEQFATPANQGVFANGLAYNAADDVLGNVPNAFFGRVAPSLSGATNSLVWENIPLDPPGTTNQLFSRRLRITNVRVNANNLTSSTLLPASAIMAISITPTVSSTGAANPLPAFSGQQAVGTARPGLDQDQLFRTIQGTANLPATGVANVSTLQCEPTNILTSASFADFTSTGENLRGIFRVRFSEGFTTAFKVRGIGSTAGTNAVTQAQGVVEGVGRNTETGFYPSGTNFVAAPNSRALDNVQLTGLADTGTRLYVRLTDLPEGVTILASTSTLTSSSVSLATLASATATGASTTATNTAGNTFTAETASQTGIVGTLRFVPLAVTTVNNSRTAQAVYEVLGSNGEAIEFHDAVIAIRYAQTTTTPALGTARVSAGFAPNNLTIAPAGFGTPIPRFVEGSPRTAFTIAECNTSILFPFVTNQAGFDTGMVISNTSQDPFGTALQRGNCTLNFYGEGATAGQPPAVTQATFGPLTAGAHAAFLLSSGGAIRNSAAGVTLVQPAGNAGFQGYVIAVCGFQYGHGFAFITDGFGGAPEIAQGYLALILNPGGAGNNRGLNVSESLGH